MPRASVNTRPSPRGRVAMPAGNETLAALHNKNKTYKKIVDSEKVGPFCFCFIFSLTETLKLPVEGFCFFGYF